MKASSRLAMAAGALALAGFAAGDAALPTVYGSMKHVVAPQMQLVWDLTNAALDDEGAVDSAQLQPEAWAGLAEAARRLNDEAQALAAAAPLSVAAPGETIQDEAVDGGVAAAQVQARIDADPQAFAAESRAFAETAALFAAAAEARDPAALNEQLGRLNEGCESCHQKFWYPQ